MMMIMDIEATTYLPHTHNLFHREASSEQVSAYNFFPHLFPPTIIIITTFTITIISANQIMLDLGTGPAILKRENLVNTINPSN